MKNFLRPLMALLVLTAASCSKDDGTASDPNGTVMLNMLDESNGKTILGDSGIYIDKAQNFVAGGDCSLFAFGSAASLGSARVKSLENPTLRIAVQAGHAYVACRRGAMVVFPSGKMALPIWDNRVNYLKFYVTSQLKEGDNIIGAAVKYVTVKPETYGLPEYESIVLTIDFNNYNLNDEVALTLPDADLEYDFHGNADITCEKRGRKLFFRASSVYGNTGGYVLYLRIRESYTKVYVEFVQ